jgi:hypothetical protein
MTSRRPRWVAPDYKSAASGCVRCVVDAEAALIRAVVTLVALIFRICWGRCAASPRQRADVLSLRRHVHRRDRDRSLNP